MLTRTKPDLLEVHAWQPVYAVPNDVLFAPTVLLDFELPYEYPRTVQPLLQYLEIKGVPSSRVLAHLMLASERVSQGAPLYVGVGNTLARPRRRPRAPTTTPHVLGNRTVRSHQAARCLLRLRHQNHYRGRETPEQIQALIDSVWDTLIRLAERSTRALVPCYGNRPEIINRRDEGTAMDWFRGKRVALWGCGAIAD